MTKDVIISISGLQYEGYDDNPLPVEVMNPAEYYFKNNSHYIIYDEISPDFSGSTKNRVKIKNNTVEISKKGTTTVIMKFEMDKKNQTYYQTPFGTLLVALYTHNIEFTNNENELVVKIEYELEIDSNPIADCKIKISVTPKESTLLS